MPNNDHLNVIKEGAVAWNTWREDHRDTVPDLSWADLHALDLRRAALDEADLRGAYFANANLSHANLSGSDLRNADLSSAFLRKTNLTRAKLHKATLIESNLREADLSDSDLSQANLGRSSLSEANFLRANLSESLLLDTDLGKANLQETTLIGADLSGADLREAILIKANLQQTTLIGANLSGADLSEADLSGADLSYTHLVNTNFSNARLNSCAVFGASAWKVTLEGTVQRDLIITDQGEPIITVDNLEVAQFIYLMLNNQKIRDVINSVTDKGVSILGRFGGGGLEVLQAIASKLREMQYLPIIFNFERPRDKTYTETVSTLVGLSRFVIVDLSGPSVAQELYATVPHFAMPFVPIMEKGRNPYSMFVDLLEKDHVLKPIVEFESVAELLELMPARIIGPAEEKHQQRQKLLEQLFNR